MSAPLHVSFVCTGNICRSPIARLVFAQAAAAADLTDQVRVSSAGTGDWHAGEPASELAQRVLADAGYPTAHTASGLSSDHLGADLIVALHRSHLPALRTLGVPDSRVRLLRTFDPDATSDSVDDPYGGSIADYQRTLREVQAAIPGLIEWVKTHA